MTTAIPLPESTSVAGKKRHLAQEYFYHCRRTTRSGEVASDSPETSIASVWTFDIGLKQTFFIQGFSGFPHGPRLHWRLCQNDGPLVRPWLHQWQRPWISRAPTSQGINQTQALSWFQTFAAMPSVSMVFFLISSTGGD